MSELTLTVDGAGSFSKWTGVTIERDITKVAGGFTLDYDDEGRSAQALPNLIAKPPFFRAIKRGMAFEVAIDGETVMIGWLGKLHVGWKAGGLSASVQGRDKTGDLADCAALPTGPAEFHGVDLLHVAKQVCAPFGISVRAETDIGEPFERLAMAPHEKALAFLEKAARQRSVLLTSDGVGGLLLTSGGSSPGPAAITLPGNIQEVEFEDSEEGRFSDIFVKGQTDGRRTHGAAPALDSSWLPLGASGAPVAPSATTTAASTVLMTGHARDPEITRWRPDVRLTRTQSGMSTTQEQAEWAVRVARGLGTKLTYTVLGWRAGPDKKLWRPNQVVQVVDPWSGIDKKMLISAVRYRYGAEGEITLLTLVGVTAFDRINEAEKRRHRTTRNAVNRPLDSTWSPLKATTP
jgi:prophage tail gpP-like protein